MDFLILADSDGAIRNPFAGRILETGEWLEGTVSAEFLTENFGHCESLDECIQATESEGLKLFFEHLKAQL